jgi:hypothetical protein
MGDGHRRVQYNRWTAKRSVRPFVRWHRYSDHLSISAGFLRARLDVAVRLCRVR